MSGLIGVPNASGHATSMPLNGAPQFALPSTVTPQIPQPQTPSSVQSGHVIQTAPSSMDLFSGISLSQADKDILDQDSQSLKRKLDAEEEDNKRIRQKTGKICGFL